jgi:hypothetical protein
MALAIRTGTFGDYWGNDYGSSNTLSQDQMEINALYIYSYLKHKGWTDNSIAALLGNMQSESAINPGRWQSDRVGGDSSGHGYGLVQWTPYTKYTEWCSSNGYGDPSEMDTNLARIIYEVENNIQWIATSVYDMTFEDFSKSINASYILAKAFMLCYERPADQSVEKQNQRGEQANYWYTYLTGKEPYDPNVSTKKKNKHFKFILFNRKRWF